MQKAILYGISLPQIMNIPVNIRNWSKAASPPLRGAPPADVSDSQ